METNRAMYEEDEILELEFDDGTAFTVGIMGIFDVDDVSYIALERLDNGNNDVYLYRYIEGEGEGDFEMVDIPEEDFDRVSQEFDRLMDEPV